MVVSVSKWVLHRVPHPCLMYSWVGSNWVSLFRCYDGNFIWICACHFWFCFHLCSTDILIEDVSRVWHWHMISSIILFSYITNSVDVFMFVSVFYRSSQYMHAEAADISQHLGRKFAFLVLIQLFRLRGLDIIIQVFNFSNNFLVLSF